MREYWIVNPDENLLHAFRLIDGKFQLHGTFSSEDSIKIGIFKDVTIDLSHVFEPISPEEEETLQAFETCEVFHIVYIICEAYSA